jgi:hypothetical protein
MTIQVGKLYIILQDRLTIKQFLTQFDMFCEGFNADEVKVLTYKTDYILIASTIIDYEKRKN